MLNAKNALIYRKNLIHCFSEEKLPKKCVQQQVEKFPLGTYMSKEKSEIIMEAPYSHLCNRWLCQEAQ